MDCPSLTLTHSQLSVLELLLNGSLYPLAGYMGRDACETCVCDRRLPDGTFWPVPIVLDVDEEIANLAVAGQLSLRDSEGVAVALLDVTERWKSELNRWRLAGNVEAIAASSRHDFNDLIAAPDQIKRETEELGWKSVVAYQTEGLIHRAEHAFLRGVSERLGAGLLIQALLPPGPPDAWQYTRAHAYRHALDEFGGTAKLMFLQGPRWLGASGAGLRAIIAKNHGATHLIGPPQGSPDALSTNDAARIGMDVIEAPRSLSALSEDQIAAMLAQGKPLASDFTFPGVAAELQRAVRPRSKQGFTLWFTGFSGAGKSTVANAVRARLMEIGTRKITLLDGDAVRLHLSHGLGFSAEDRDRNIRRIGFVAGEVTKHGGVAICAAISPRDELRREVRRAIEAQGGFVLIFVDTPLDVCAARDRKGLYARAKAGLIKDFTGISAPYDRPGDAEITLRTAEMSREEAVAAVLAHLQEAGYLADSCD